MSINLIFSYISKTIISSQSLCLAAAQNTILVDIGMAENIKINNVNLTQIADASVSCSSNVEIDVESMQRSIQDTLIRFLNNTEVPKNVNKFVEAEKISKVFTAENVGACITSAKNAYRISIENIQGDFIWRDFNLEQYATAQLQECSMSFVIGDKLLKNYITEDIFGLQDTVPCSQKQNNKHVIIGVVFGILILILGVATLVVGLRPTKKKIQT